MKLYLLVTVALCGTVYGAKNSGNTIEFLYASSLYRSNHLLENVAQISIFDSVQRPSHCLAHCLASKNSCRAFNYSPNGTCILLAESLCANETYELTASEHFHYYDIMTTYDFEKKHLTDQYCRIYGKCSGKCYPRSPLSVERKMSRQEAYNYCRSRGRKLAQPRSQSENIFYGDFGRKFIREMLVGENQTTTTTTTKNLKSFHEKQYKEARFWLGITDDEVEGYWLYDDDGSPVAEIFSAWAVSQPDNGGSFSGPENCVAIEMRDGYNWFDVGCDLQLNVFCA